MPHGVHGSGTLLGQLLALGAVLEIGGQVLHAQNRMTQLRLDAFHRLDLAQAHGQLLQGQPGTHHIALAQCLLAGLHQLGQVLGGALLGQQGLLDVGGQSLEQLRQPEQFVGSVLGIGCRLGRRRHGHCRCWIRDALCL
ncbi:MAG TPA: hypothetical protein H9903_10070 [Candidatus Aquabacterium excrementipullorum]|nr:hypothetical protein [Candidatus Aquabacterium excrementipullorum]